MTAYELRISVWSSDVCSSDLHYQIDPDDNHRPGGCQLSGLERRRFQHWGSGEITGEALKSGAVLRLRKGMSEPGQFMSPSSGIVRSEEHTSELQSLMRISYAVFCLKKKKTKQKST